MKKFIVYSTFCLSLFLLLSACADEKGYPLPQAIGTINGNDTNSCPGKVVLLSIEEVNGADWYQWYKDGTPINGATGLLYTVFESGSYAVEGVNAAAAGPRSEPKTVSIIECPAIELKVDDLVGTWTVTEDQLYVGSTWDAITYTMRIEKKSETAIKVIGFLGATSRAGGAQPLDSLVCTVASINEDSLAVTIPAQAVTPVLPPGDAGMRFVAINPYYKITGPDSYYYNPIMPKSYENVNFTGTFIRNEDGVVILAMKSSEYPDSEDFLSYAFVRTDPATGEMYTSLYNVYIFSQNCMWVKNP